MICMCVCVRGQLQNDRMQFLTMDAVIAHEGGEGEGEGECYGMYTSRSSLIKRKE